MKIEVNESRGIVLKEVFNGIILESADGEQLVICMRDSGFELNYIVPTHSVPMELKKGEVIQTGTEGGGA